MDNAEKTVARLAALLGLLLCGAIVGSIIAAVVDQACLRCGWRQGKVTIMLEHYCIREENEYEITRPLWWVQEHCEKVER